MMSRYKARHAKRIVEAFLMREIIYKYTKRATHHDAQVHLFLSAQVMTTQTQRMLY